MDATDLRQPSRRPERCHDLPDLVVQLSAPARGQRTGPASHPRDADGLKKRPIACLEILDHLTHPRCSDRSSAFRTGKAAARPMFLMAYGRSTCAELASRVGTEDSSQP